ncbi:hypothetical protein JW916_15110 [Candidatus Sumerlaeota bacterium]|nr:hypothetical protein [Candidatus Sumerlaeota bacterium]
MSAVLDQGPDIEGIRTLLLDVSNDLYEREVRFLHTPLLFFKELGIAIDRIVAKHESVKAIRAELWAAENRSTPAKYNLFMDNTKQALDFAVFRWGVPLALPLLLERDEPDDEKRVAVLCKHLRSCRSAEDMSQQVKDHERYGLGKAIGDKACHLFAKWVVSSFPLLEGAEKSWGRLSYEVPFDSNAGRVLWRTGFFSLWATDTEYVAKEVVQKGQGKGGLHYIRVTNIRGMKASSPVPQAVREAYSEICVDHLRTHSRGPKTVEIQRLPHAFLLASGSQLGVAEFDDGLIHVGTKFCFNHAEPKCSSCPLGPMCEGNLRHPELIRDYRT